MFEYNDSLFNCRRHPVREAEVKMPVLILVYMYGKLKRLFTEHFGTVPDTVSPICGSASNRCYCRLSSGPVSCIGVVGTDLNENRAFVSLAEHFRAKGLPVPEILAVDSDAGAYLQEDLGDTPLFSLAEQSAAGGWSDSVPRLLCRTMALLAKIQTAGAEGLDFGVCYPQQTFDRRTVMFDLNYFKYCFLKPSGLEFNEILLQDDFELFADDLLEDAAGNTFMYRDFQARNVMVRDGEPYFIDFQGGRKGPVHYDVASFVWQARAAYPEDLRGMMIGAYLDALSEHIPVDRAKFMERLRLFVLFRTLQVLGAYGFRGWIEHKAQFVVSISAAVSNLRALLSVPFGRYPYLSGILKDMAGLPRFAPDKNGDGRLEVKVYSFSYKKGIPEDASGNGGGYVFDCRGIHNPGRYAEYRSLTGMDEPVIKFLGEGGQAAQFLENIYAIVEPHIETYVRRGFTDLSVAFGCTGGRHRSVYCAEHLAGHLAAKYPDIRVKLIHREQNIVRWVEHNLV